jgi:ubiquinone/menaquinone biosynthesis C-methylase UbiE
MSSERQEHNIKSPWWGEHIHRYNVALNYISETDKVIDIACGNGFGSSMISNKTKGIVIGADISNETIEYCSTKFSNQPNLEFKIVDGTNISFEDNYFEKLISFETIEHTTQYKKMIQEFYRVLKSKGIAVISTPNIIVNTPDGVKLSKFHTQEFTYDELFVILKEVFDEVEIYGQKYTRYNSKTFRNVVGKIVENILYTRGVRKLPLSLQNKIMHLLINKDMYPLPDDFDLVKNKNEILECKTFYVICRKK